MKKTVLLLMFLAVEALHPECDGQEIDGAAIFRQEFRQIRPVLPRPDTVSMIFLGDIMLHAEQIRKASLTQTRPAERDTCGYGRFDFSQYFLFFFHRSAIMSQKDISPLLSIFLLCILSAKQGCQFILQRIIIIVSSKFSVNCD